MSGRSGDGSSLQWLVRRAYGYAHDAWAINGWPRHRSITRPAILAPNRFKDFRRGGTWHIISFPAGARTLPRTGMIVVWRPKYLGCRKMKVAGAGFADTLAGDEPARDQSQNQIRDKTHAAFRHGNSV
jgi:hypothetical protein